MEREPVWCEKVFRNVADSSDDPHRREVDYLDLEWSECRNVVNKLTIRGEPVRILLPSGERLRHGDVIYEDSARLTMVRVLPCEVVVTDISDAQQLAVLAMELGNLHLPAEVTAAGITFIEDSAAMRVLRAMCISWRRESRRFEPTTIISMPGLDRGEIKLIRSKG